MIKKRGNKWCVLHGSPQKKNSKTDKPPGSVIKCFSSKEDALAMHRAIMVSKAKKKK